MFKVALSTVGFVLLELAVVGEIAHLSLLDAGAVLALEAIGTACSEY